MYNDIALGLVENGFECIVLTTTPHYNVIESELIKQPIKKKLFGLYSVSSFKGITVYHIPLKKYRSTLLRIFSFIYWHLFSFIFGLTFRNLSFVLSPSPPLSIGFVSLILAKLKGAKSIYNVQEIYPDLLINQGSLKSAFIIGLLKKFEKYIYDNSSAVTTIDQVFYSQISSRFKDVERLHIIPNFVDTALYRPIKSNLEVPAILDPVSDKIKLIYAGNIGFFQDWEPIIYASEELKHENVEFLIIGEGVQKKYLEKMIFDKGLTNIKIYPYQNRNFMPSINNLADIHFIIINQEMEQEGFPSKVYTIMACAKPMIIVTGKKTPLYNFLNGKNCAEIITENRNQEFVNAIKKLARDQHLRIQLGNNGYNYIKDSYSKEAIISKYVNLLNSL
ncbi:glycosyltransferase family 4 protein [Aquirufa nivalisilvae]